MLSTARVRRAFAILVIALLPLLGLLSPSDAPVVAQEDARYFADTGFRIDDDTIWDYFNKRGGARTFGLPTSRTFRFIGLPTQFFQRHVLQVAGGRVQTLNLLEDGFLPYTTINGSTFPAPDKSVTGDAPTSTTPRYDTAVVEFLQRNTPDTFEGETVNFYRTFSETVTLGDAFPNGGGNAALLPLLNLELWGQPTSRPTRDPNNNDFVYQRFQRGIMHYDLKCKCTQGLLLADYLKSVITGQNLPADLAYQASDSRLFRQYDWNQHNGPLRPGLLADSDLGNAFRGSLDSSLPGSIVVVRPETPTATPSRSTATPTPTGSRATTTPGKTATKTPSGPTPVPGTPPEGNPKDVAVKLDEAGKDAKKSSDKEYADGRQKWYEVRYERPTSYAAYRAGPTTVYVKAIIAKDEETARQLYTEQAALNDKMPEARDRIGPLLDFNTETADEDLGDEAAGKSACKESSCKASRDDEYYVQRRMAFRLANLVGVVYTLGLDKSEEGNTQANTRRFATLMVGRWR